MWCNDIPNSESVGFQSRGRLVTRKCTPRKTGTVLQPCWDLSLLGCKAGLMQCGWLMVDRIEALHYSLGFAQSRHLTPGAPRKGSISIHLQHGGSPQIPFGFVQWHLRGLRAWKLWSGQNLGIFCHVVLILPRLGPVFSCGLPPPGQNFGERGKKNKRTVWYLIGHVWASLKLR